MCNATTCLTNSVLMDQNKIIIVLNNVVELSFQVKNENKNSLIPAFPVIFKD